MKNYLQIEKLSADRSTIDRSKFHLQAEEVFHLQIEELLAHQRIICSQRPSADCIIIFVQTEKLSADQSSISYADRKIVYRLKSYLQIKVRSADSSSIRRQFFNFQIVL